MESSADERTIVPSCESVFVEDKRGKATEFQFQSGRYVSVTGDGPSMRRDELVALATERKENSRARSRVGMGRTPIGNIESLHSGRWDPFTSRVAVRNFLYSTVTTKP